MKVYRTDEIRNVVLLGHGGSGKTSLAEAMLYVSGAVSRMGKISESNTTSDFDKEEQKRGFSISTSLIPIEWEKAKINILDTPGYFDFVGEVEEAVSAADADVCFRGQNHRQGLFALHAECIGQRLVPFQLEEGVSPLFLVGQRGPDFICRGLAVIAERVVVVFIAQLAVLPLGQML